MDSAALKKHIRSLARYIIKTQNKDGSIPSSDDNSHDNWDHLESAIALGVAGYRTEFEKAIEWCINNQNNDGSWYESYVSDQPIKFNKQSNHAAYFSTAIAFHYLLYKDLDYVHSTWPTIKQSQAFVQSLCGESGAIIWNIDEDGNKAKDFLLTGNSSIVKSVECAIFIGNLLDDDIAVSNFIEIKNSIALALKNPRNNFDLQKNRSRFSMDSYYPILSNILSDQEEDLYIRKTFKEFYIKDLGIKCVKEEPWITVAETCEFVICLVKTGRTKEAKKLLAEAMQHVDQDNIPFMGWQYKENIFWPDEKPSWTSAAMILALDATYKFSSASKVFLTSL
tara:strand:- start:15852 stop:16862 length:1011 start_codon:yes stop_codon:yes gene_type:complete